MDKLSVVLINDNVIRSTLRELRAATGAELWLVTSPHYLARLTDDHRAVFGRIIVADDFAPKALIDLLDRHLPRPVPASLTFLTNDESCELSSVELAHHFGQPTWTATQITPFVNKMATKAALTGVVRLPRHLEFDRSRLAADGRAYCVDIAERIGFPMVVKPIDRYASMDVRRLDSLPELRAWASWAASPKDRNTYEVDEFVHGVLYNCDSLIQDGQIIWSSACFNISPCMEFAAGRTIGVCSFPADDPVAVRVREFSARVLAALDPPDGAIHMEIFLTPDDELVFLEVAARPPGGEVRDIYRHTQHFDIDLAHYLLRAREPYVLTAEATGAHAGWALVPRHRGTVAAIDLPDLRSTHTVDLRVTVGDVIERDSAHIVEPPAAVIMFYNDDFAEFDRDVDRLRELTLYRVEA